jgi:hypothetical protein
MKALGTKVPPMDSLEYRQWQRRVINHEGGRLLRHWHSPKYSWYPDRVVVERKYRVVPLTNVSEVARNMGLVKEEVS